MTRSSPVSHTTVLLAVAAGGAIGATARFAVSHLLPVGIFPWSTLAVNVAGSFALGVVMTLGAGERGPHPVARPLVTTGFLGAFTTYSTFAAETLLLLRAGRGGAAAAYVLGSLAAGLGALWLGAMLARRRPGGAAT